MARRYSTSSATVWWGSKTARAARLAASHRDVLAGADRADEVAALLAAGLQRAAAGEV